MRILCKNVARLKFYKHRQEGILSSIFYLHMISLIINRRCDNRLESVAYGNISIE